MIREGRGTVDRFDVLMIGVGDWNCTERAGPFFIFLITYPSNSFIDPNHLDIFESCWQNSFQRVPIPPNTLKIFFALLPILAVSC